MTPFHRVLGIVIVSLFLLIFVWGVALWVLRREETPTALWVVQHWTENVLVVQVVLGLVLLVTGERVLGSPVAWLHYLYGSLFPLISIVGGRIASLRRERFEYLGIAWGSFFAFGLTLRAVQSACGISLGAMERCLGW